MQVCIVILCFATVLQVHTHKNAVDFSPKYTKVQDRVDVLKHPKIIINLYKYDFFSATALLWGPRIMDFGCEVRCLF